MNPEGSGGEEEDLGKDFFRPAAAKHFLLRAHPRYPRFLLRISGCPEPGRRPRTTGLSPWSRRRPYPRHRRAAGSRSALTIQRDGTEKKAPLPTRKSHTRYFLSRLHAREKPRATTAVRGPWSVENRHHHNRDASAWQEDRHRHRQPNAARNLALTRNVLRAQIPFEEGEPLAHSFEPELRR